jgi:predicted aldo/keto reductase-like oxidoreductase
MSGRPARHGRGVPGGACRSVYGMEYTHLGRSGVAVSRLCLGTMNFGALTSEADAQPIMDAAHEHGINFFDTSKQDA